MPAQAPITSQEAAAQLNLIGHCIRAQRKAARIAASALAEAAGLSRVTLHRIERGEPSVTIGAYLNVVAALGLALDIVAPPPTHRNAETQAAPPTSIRLADYPQLRQLAWSTPGASDLSAHEALALYERNWRHVDEQHLLPHERRLVEQLVRTLGQGRLLV